ncbi:MAG: PHP domain-containing protein [Actinobacteria bacterium]|nr:PHP domain-containing protein [Actinomycetota bacterium]
MAIKRILSLCLAVLVIFSGIPVAVAENNHGRPEKFQLIRIALTPSGSAFVAVHAETRIGFTDLKSTCLSVFAGSQEPSKQVIFKSIRVIDDLSARIVGNIDVDVELKDISGLLPTRASAQVINELFEEDADSQKSRMLREKLYKNIGVLVDLEGQNLKEGDARDYRIEATFDIIDRKAANANGRKTQAFSSTRKDTAIINDTSQTVESVGIITESANADTTLIVQALPSRPGWHCGDLHIHSDWAIPVSNGGGGWSDGTGSLRELANRARDKGLHWLIPTDHEDRIRLKKDGGVWAGGWNAYCDSTLVAQIGSGILVAPGVEITAKDLYNKIGDCLAYWMRQYSPIPENQSLPAQLLIDAINLQNPGYSFAAIAHPFGRPSWPDWNATGFRGMELISNSKTINNKAYSKWRTILNNNLASTINGNGFVVALGGSDSHFGHPGNTGQTWIYDGSFSYDNRAITWSALRAGRASASGSCSLGAIAINNYPQGRVITPTGGQDMTVKIVQQPVSGVTCKAYSLRDKTGAILLSKTYPPTENYHTIKSPPKGQLNFYFAVFDFSDGSHVITNPVFVNPQ